MHGEKHQHKIVAVISLNLIEYGFQFFVAVPDQPG